MALRRLWNENPQEFLLLNVDLLLPVRITRKANHASSSGAFLHASVRGTMGRLTCMEPHQAGPVLPQKIWLM